MSTTPDTSTTTMAARTVPLALVALGIHMLEQRLPLPIGYQIPGANNRDANAIGIHLRKEDADAWVSSIALDDVEITASDVYVYDHRLGRLPDSGVRVDIFFAIDRVTPLQVVAQ